MVLLNLITFVLAYWLAFLISYTYHHEVRRAILSPRLSTDVPLASY